MLRRAVLLVLPALWGTATPARAQRQAEVASGAPRPIAPARDSLAPARAGSLRELSRREWIRPVASLIIPGTGQLLARQDRGVVYLATEIWLVARASSLTREGHRGRRAFQDLAYHVARASFTPVRRDGNFDYYESMTHFVESGMFDRDPGPAVDPEPDTLTFNGATWLLARRTFFADPDSLPDPQSAPFQQALGFYARRAVRDDFRWSWRDARLEQDVFRAQIRASDDAFRTATNYLGALVLNHLGSAVDALIAIRVSGRRVPAPQITPGADPGQARLVWSVRF